MSVNPPWIMSNTALPPEGEEALWMDCDGCFHLCRLIEGRLMPVIYAGGDQVMLRISDYPCWMAINPPAGGELSGVWESTSDNLPGVDTEAVWLDEEGGYHLGTVRGQKAKGKKHVSLAVYGNSPDVLRSPIEFQAYMLIPDPLPEVLSNG